MMNEKKKFTIKIDGKVFTSDEDGFLNLNDIWRVCNLPEKKRPSEWKSSIRKLLDDSDNIRKRLVITGTSVVPTNMTFGSEKATIAYAMFVSNDFYMTVVDSFIGLRHGKLEQAVELAGSTMSDKDNYYLQKIMQMKGLCFTKSCWYANIPHPNKLINVLHKLNKWNYTAINSVGKIYATKEGIDSGYFYNCYGEPESSKVVMRITKSGREMFREHYQYFNSLVEKYN